MSALGMGVDESISIHSLRMEGDTGYDENEMPIYGISIHSLRMEGDA